MTHPTIRLLRGATIACAVGFVNYAKAYREQNGGPLTACGGLLSKSERQFAMLFGTSTSDV